MIERLTATYPDLEWNRDTDIFGVLNRSDILISDFSGIIFDLSLVFDKPVICAYTDFDKDTYDAWWLETPIWTATAIPRIGPILREENIPEIKSMIDKALEDKSYTESRHEVRNETWLYRGEGATRAADYLMAKYKELTKVEYITECT
jgi:CDP-glycerol glycerophosphotransferase (TagB/SpsB family)